MGRALLDCPAPALSAYPAREELARDVAQQSEAALEGIAAHIRRTPLHRSVALERNLGGDTRVFLKLENEQITGSFKARGASHKLAQCKRWSVTNVTTASTGNHALATVHALQSTGISGTIYLPTTAAPGKIAKIETLIARGTSADQKITLASHGDECMASEVEARAVAEKDPATVFVSPYNDIDVIVGQSTLAVEIESQLSELPDVVFASVGGGGMISGIASYLKHRASEAGKEITIVGCQPERDSAMYDCVKAGHIVEIDGKDTLSDGTAGNVEEGSVTLPYCACLVDKWALVSEEEIKEAVQLTLNEDSKLIEGAAGVAVAGFLQADEALTKDKTSVIIICGGNVSAQKAMKLLA